jgi:hypothetical protein
MKFSVVFLYFFIDRRIEFDIEGRDVGCSSIPSTDRGRTHQINEMLALPFLAHASFTIRFRVKLQKRPFFFELHARPRAGWLFQQQQHCKPFPL